MNVNNIDTSYGVDYHYEHMNILDANKWKHNSDRLHIVEAVNWTYGDSDKSQVHLNKYFAVSFYSALAIATRIAMESIEVAETVHGIRIATAEEVKFFLSFGSGKNGELIAMGEM